MGAALTPIEAVPWPELERRAFRRVPMHLTLARATSVTTSRSGLFEVRLLDLSAGGAFIATPQPLASGTPVRLYIPPSLGIDRLDVVGEVVRVLSGENAWQAGVAFVDLPEELRDLIIRRVMLEDLRNRR